MMSKLKLKIGGVPEHFNLPWRLAVEEGDFQKENLDLEWKEMPEGTGQMIKELKNKTIDIAVILTEGITKAILQGLDAKILQVYVTSPLHWGIHVPFNDSSIQKTNDLEEKTFAISRKGSGSELMTYVLADQQKWDTNKLTFKSVGDIHNLLLSLETNTASAFLWEKFTTQPYVEQNKCRYIDEVVTPWPCFVVAVRTEVFEQYKEELQRMLKVVNHKSKQLKNNENAVNLFAQRYGLKSENVAKWLKDTDWNYEGIEFNDDFEIVIDYLLKLNLITSEEAKNYIDKLF